MLVCTQSRPAPILNEALHIEPAERSRLQKNKSGTISERMLFLAVVVTLGVLATSVSASDAELLIQTTLGPVKGSITERGVRLWAGLPYAEPPVGNLRWTYPQPPKPTTEVYDASYVAPGCQQDCQLPPGNCPEQVSEDCLYLSVTAPPEPSTDGNGYPVFFWIHGGAFEQGSGNSPLYDGTTFATQGVITVVVNYRLGVLGFMASESMQGNYGLMDQRLALQWVNDNIAAFGGDPKRITIGGQSAGGMSVGAHLTMPGSKGLFAQSVMESNCLGMPYHTRESATKNANSAFEYLKCDNDDVSCMRSKSAEEILDAQANSVKMDRKTLFINFLPFAPLVEYGGELPLQPLVAMASGQMAQVPMLSGTVLSEGQLFVYELFTSKLSKTKYHAALDTIFGWHNAKKVKKMYPFDIVPGSKDGREAFNVLATDLIFGCPLRNVTRGYQNALGLSAIPTYQYRLDHVMSFDCWGPQYTFCVDVVCHGSELPFVFNTFAGGNDPDGNPVSYNPTADEKALAADVGGAWANFITTGNPNKGTQSVPMEFKPYSAASGGDVVILDEPAWSEGSNERSEFCDMWDSLGYFY
jgi:carboxylesterase type B